MNGTSDPTKPVKKEKSEKRDDDRAQMAGHAARGVTLRIYDKFFTCGPDSGKGIPVGLVLGDRVEVIVGTFPRDITLIEVLETAKARRDKL